MLSSGALPSAMMQTSLGPEELAWLHQQLAEGRKAYAALASQLQRVQQESVAMRSSLLAQRTPGLRRLEPATARGQDARRRRGCSSSTFIFKE